MKILFGLLVTVPYGLVRAWGGLLSLFHRSFKRVILTMLNKSIDQSKEYLSHTENGRKVNLVFHTPNELCLYRAESFSNKEPETLEWIEEFGKDGGVLFDIGANIGLYSIYHSMLNKAETIAFEPSFFNLKLLSKNININSCQDLITVVSNPLAIDNGVQEFKYGEAIEGGALSTFGVDFGYDGKKFDYEFTVKVIGMSLDSMMKAGYITKYPNLVKIDVDGIEHLILAGASDVLSNDSCRSILIEVNDNFEKQASSVSEILIDYGYTLFKKSHAEEFDTSKYFSTTFNQIWVKNKLLNKLNRKS